MAFLQWDREDVGKWIESLGYSHYTAIAAHVRELLGVSEPVWNRSLADYPRDDMGLFLERKSQTGELADALTLTQFLKERQPC
ncbi:sterile alpha motif domain-containing protein 15-like isoform X2 [Alosa alosa]|uniref:sterile alpha motif domain-containing protein 15-like isoform X2 n=1 Tax=Alosa alosa TaxID=278164 RepID=UPI0020153BAD|nr:sterile alpha motif domain-containing protein 15-like isoform X2 [Alosa alosa]